MIGMTVAILTTFNIGHNLIVPMVGIAILIGALIGIFAAKKVEMTSMPELVALMHSFVGLAAVLIAIAAVFNTNDVLGEESPLREKINNTAENKYNNEAMI